MWHASVAVLSMAMQRTLSTSELSPEQRATAIAVAKSLLDGVGQFPSAVELHPVGLHYRRSLTDEEYAALPAAWCAIPAVHEAGVGLVLERNT